MTPPIPPQPLPEDSAITPDDVERAKLAWEASAPGEFKNLLDAEVEESDA